jgi:predicted transcriptional regulator
MRSTTNVSITMPTGMAKEAARLAKRENRTMSELMREALRHYTARRQEERADDLQWVEHLIAAANGSRKRTP